MLMSEEAYLQRMAAHSRTSLKAHIDAYATAHQGSASQGRNSNEESTKL